MNKKTYHRQAWNINCKIQEGRNLYETKQLWRQLRGVLKLLDVWIDCGGNRAQKQQFRHECLTFTNIKEMVSVVPIRFHTNRR